MRCLITFRQPIGPDRFPGPGPGFTLIEFILVMALLATLMAMVAPKLSGSIRQRRLEQEASRLVALTEYGRSEAIAQGVPMVIWIDPPTRRFGIEAKPGFLGRTNRFPEFELDEDIDFDLGSETRGLTQTEAIEFAPDGWLESHSVQALRLMDRWESSVVVAQMTNGWGYEVLKENDYAMRVRQGW